MSDVLNIVWRADSLDLICVPTTGEWSSSVSPLKDVKIDLPTRIGRLEDHDSKGHVLNALTDLLDGIDLSLPIWLLIPNDWIQRFEIKLPSLTDRNLLMDHLVWEVEQRLHGDRALYSILLPEDLSVKSASVLVCRREIVVRLREAMKATGVEFAGLWLEPEDDVKYDFAQAGDLRKAKPIDEHVSGKLKASLTIPPFIGIGLIAVVAVAIAVFFLLPFQTDKSLKTGSEPLKQQPVAKEIPPAVTTPEVMTDQKSSPQEIRSPVAQQVSPLTLLSQKLPGNSFIKLATISPVEFRVEVVGIANPDAWLKELSSVDALKSLSIKSRYSESGNTVLVLNQTEIGWNPKSSARNPDLWEKLAANAGLKVDGRTATGNFKSALTLVDAVWSNPAGFSKIYFASDSGSWRVTVQ